VHGHRPAAEVIPMAMAVKASVQRSAGDDMKMLQVNTLTQLGKYFIRTLITFLVVIQKLQMCFVQVTCLFIADMFFALKACFLH